MLTTAHGSPFFAAVQVTRIESLADDRVDVGKLTGLLEASFRAELPADYFKKLDKKYARIERFCSPVSESPETGRALLWPCSFCFKQTSKCSITPAYGSFTPTADLTTMCLPALRTFPRRLWAIYISETHRGVAIVTREHGSVPYLDKFSVMPSAQGDRLGELVWQALCDGEKELFWRSRADNPVNAWYYEASLLSPSLHSFPPHLISRS